MAIGLGSKCSISFFTPFYLSIGFQSLDRAQFSWIFVFVQSTTEQIFRGSRFRVIADYSSNFFLALKGRVGRNTDANGTECGGAGLVLDLANITHLIVRKHSLTVQM